MFVKYFSLLIFVHKLGIIIVYRVKFTLTNYQNYILEFWTGISKPDVLLLIIPNSSQFCVSSLWCRGFDCGL